MNYCLLFLLILVMFVLAPDHLLLFPVVLGNQLFLHSSSSLSSPIKQNYHKNDKNNKHGNPGNDISLQACSLNPEDETDQDTKAKADSQDKYDGSNGDFFAVEWIVVFGDSCEVWLIGTDSS